MNRRDRVITTVQDSALRFCIYDRKDDERLSSADLVESIVAMEISIDEIGLIFADAIKTLLRT